MSAECNKCGIDLYYDGACPRCEIVGVLAQWLQWWDEESHSALPSEELIKATRDLVQE